MLIIITATLANVILTAGELELPAFVIDVRGPYVTPGLNNKLQCNVGNMWRKLPYIYMH